MNILNKVFVKFGFKIQRVTINKSKLNVEHENPYSGANIIGNINNIKIGKNVFFGGNVTLYANEKISIGDNTIIAINTLLHTSTHDANSHPVWTFRIDRPIQIGKYVWIGTGAIILPGTIIGDYAIIGAGSVITANVPKAAIVAGNPARIIRYRNEKVYKKKPAINSVTEAQISKEDYLQRNCKLK